MSRRPQAGIALIATLVVLVTLFAIGIVILTVATSSFNASRSYSGAVGALHIADSGIEQIIAKQSDTGIATRYLFDNGSYQSATIVDSPYFNDVILYDDNGDKIGRSVRQILGPDPRSGVNPPYVVQSIGYYQKSAGIIDANWSSSARDS